MIKRINLLLVWVMMVLFNVNMGMAADETVSSMGFQYIEVDGHQVPVGQKVTMDDATSYVEKKGYQIIEMLQKVAKPITLVVMVGCGLMAVISGLTGGQGKGSGSWMWAAVISALCYTAVMYSPVILQFIVTFMQP